MLTDVLTAVGIDGGIAKQQASEIVNDRSPLNAAGGPELLRWARLAPGEGSDDIFAARSAR